MSRVLLALACLTLLISPALAEDWSGKMETVEGVTHVKNPAKAPVQKTLELQERFRLGGETDDINEFFGVVSDILVDDEGNFYILDSQLNEVKVFDSAGTYLRSLGREGEGPGEFRGPNGLTWLADGSIGVMQVFPSRIIVLTKDGEPAGDLGVPADPNGGFRILFSADRAGDHLAMIYASNKPTQTSFEQVSTLVFSDFEGNEEAQLFEQSSMMDLAGAKVEELQWDNFRNRFAALPDGRAVIAASYHDYELTVFAADGSIDRMIHREYAPDKRTAEELKEVETIYRGFTRQIPVPDLKFTIEEVWSPVNNRGVFAREDGSIWVQPSTTRNLPAGEMGTFDVYDAEGRLMQQVTMKADYDSKLDQIFFVGDHLIVVTEFLAAAMNAQGGDYSEETGREPEPMEVIIYDLGGMQLGQN